MSIHYLIDPFTLNGDIIDVLTSESGQTDSTGATVIRIPDGVAIRNDPHTLIDTIVPPLTGLLTGKYDGLLASFAGFTQIVADSCMNAPPDFGVLSSKSALLSSGFVNHTLMANGHIATATVILPFAPTQAIAVWEAYTFTESNDKTGRYQRVYTEIPPGDPTDFQVTMTFDGISNNPVTEGAVLNIPLAGQGTTFRFDFTNPNPSGRLYLGSWAVIF